MQEVVEVYKARMTIGLAFLVGLVTMSGYSLTTNKPVLLLLASFIPIVAFLCDLAINYFETAPFIYDKFVKELPDPSNEGLVTLFLAFASSRQQDRLAAIKRLAPGVERQRSFQKFYGLRNVFAKGCFCSAGSMGVILLWCATK